MKGGVASARSIAAYLIMFDGQVTLQNATMMLGMWATAGGGGSDSPVCSCVNPRSVYTEWASSNGRPSGPVEQRHEPIDCDMEDQP